MPDRVYKIKKNVQTPGAQLKILIDCESVFNGLEFSCGEFQTSPNKQIVFQDTINAVIRIDKVVVSTNNDIPQSLQRIALCALGSFVKVVGDKNKSLQFFCWIESCPQFGCLKSLIRISIRMRIIQRGNI